MFGEAVARVFWRGWVVAREIQTYDWLVVRGS